MGGLAESEKGTSALKPRAVGTVDAVFFDWSNSALLVVDGSIQFSQAGSKDGLTTFGLGFG